MAHIIPFHGIRYDNGKTFIGDVATKPYDKISATEQDLYYHKSPYNCVRLILGKQTAGDSELDNRYTRAANTLKQWIDEKILVREEAPALYIYDQQFQAEGYPSMKRRALVGLCRLEPYSAKVVFPHEKTLTGPKQDRLNLLKTTKTQFGHIFMLYKDERNDVNTQLDMVAKTQAPLYKFTDSIAVTHKFWRVSDTGMIKKITGLFTDKQLLIADGHHRYETALNYCREMTGSDPADKPDSPYAYQMMSFVNMYDPGLLILPTHRAVRQADVPDGWFERLESYFYLETVARSRFSLRDIDHEGTVKIGLYRGGDSVNILTLKNKDAVSKLMAQGKPPAWYGLPVTVLHDVILDHLMGIDKEKLAAQSHVSYPATLDQGYDMVDDGSHRAVFFVPPTPIDAVCDISFAGETMPQKSTDFFPKIYTGLVFNKLD
ncbi:MAG: DUF1015 domain-containing protein [Candidatus Auribacterota bacterium]|jgi:uncharacterized protein (DUF1015 family)|nr:DUF1015 domain-containing protein [Candidatus Auribacterota bacterium]